VQYVGEIFGFLICLLIMKIFIKYLKFEDRHTLEICGFEIVKCDFNTRKSLLFQLFVNCLGYILLLSLHTTPNKSVLPTMRMDMNNLECDEVFIPNRKKYKEKVTASYLVESRNTLMV
jgi:hypothetical protein